MKTRLARMKGENRHSLSENTRRSARVRIGGLVLGMKTRLARVKGENRHSLSENTRRSARVRIGGAGARDENALGAYER